MMKFAFAAMALLALSACEETTMAAMSGGNGAAASVEALPPMGEPTLSNVTVGGKVYTVRRIANDRVPVVNLVGSIDVQPDGSEMIVPPAPGGTRIANSVRVAGATGLVEAAGVMLRVCGKNPATAPRWAPEPVPFQTDTGEFVFSNVC